MTLEQCGEVIQGERQASVEDFEDAGGSLLGWKNRVDVHAVQLASETDRRADTENPPNSPVRYPAPIELGQCRGLAHVGVAVRRHRRELVFWRDDGERPLGQRRLDPKDTRQHQTKAGEPKAAESLGGSWAHGRNVAPQPSHARKPQQHHLSQANACATRATPAPLQKNLRVRSVAR